MFFMRREIEVLCQRIVANDITRIDKVNRRLDDDDVCAIATVLATNTSVTSIDVENNCIGARGARALADALTTNTSVVVVNLSRNLMGDDGASAMAAMLTTNKHITNIVLAHNYIGTDGVCALATALANNTSVTSISLAWNGVTAIGVRALVDAFATNTTMLFCATHGDPDGGYNHGVLDAMILRNKRIAAQRLVAIMGHATSALQRLPLEVYVRILRALARRHWDVELCHAIAEHLVAEKRRRTITLHDQ